MRLIDADSLAYSNAYVIDEAGFGANFQVVYLDDINRAPTINPVYAAGRCYCGECFYYKIREDGLPYCNCPDNNKTYNI